MRRLKKLNKILILIKVSLFTYLHLKSTFTKQIFPLYTASPISRSTLFQLYMENDWEGLLSLALVLFSYIDTF